MAITLTHPTVAVGTDSGTGEIHKAEWNANHTLLMATARLLGRTTAGGGAVEEISVGSGLTLSAGSLSASSSSALTYLATLTASSSATLDDTTHITSTYDEYMIVFEDVLPASNNVNFGVRYSTNAGSTWISTGYINNDDGSATDRITMNRAVVNNNAVGPSTISSTSNYGGFSGTAFFTNPNSAKYKKFQFDTTTVPNGDATVGRSVGAGIYNGATTAINGLRFLMDSGNIASGLIKIYGIQKS